MSILSTIFGNRPEPVTPANPGPNNPAALTTGKAPEGAPAGNVEDPNKSPLDNFSQMWEPSKTPQPGSEPVNFGADPAKLMEAATKIDFAKIIKPEQLAAISAGGDGATQALVSVLNSMQQQTYAQSTFAATKIAETAAAQVTENFQKQLPALLRRAGLQEKLVDDNPALSHPAIQPMMEAMQTVFAASNPDATAAELANMTREYMSEVGKVFSAPNAATRAATTSAAKKKTGATDWSRFFPQNNF